MPSLPEGTAVRDLRARLVERHGLGWERYGGPLVGVERAVRALGDPQESFATVHVTGTNGSGSVAEFVAAALTAAGHDVGLFAELTVTGDVRGKFRVNGDPVDEATLSALVADVVDRVTTRDEWDVLVATALERFARADVDIAVVETGAGGRDDATNVLDAEVSVVTNAEVTPEHPRLGETDAAVARNKAGIVASGAVVVTNGSATVRETVADVAETVGADHVPAGEPVAFAPDGRTYVAAYGGARVSTRLAAPYQCENVQTAVTALAAGPFDVPAAAVRRTLASFAVPGRCEFVGTTPEFLLDGAHNPTGAAALGAVLDRIDAPATLVFTGSDDGWRETLAPLAARADRVVATETPVYEVSAETIAASLDGGAVAEPEPWAAVERALARRGPDDLVVVAGSLYLLAAVRDRIVAAHGDG